MSGADAQNWWHGFYRELKQRRVIRVATLYVILCWPVIQIADILSPALDLPNDAMRYLLLVFASGLPIVLGLSWLFDLNKSGIVRSGARAEESSTPVAEQALLGRRLERGLIGVLLVVIAVLFYLQYSSEFAKNSRDAEGGSVKAIAVLPFATFSESSDDRFFADGLTEEVLNVLSKLQNLRVIARTSSFAYKDVRKNVQDIGRELQVDTILEGSVRRNDIDDTIRVTAQLIDVDSGTHLWSQTFDRQFRDVFKIQDEIAAAVVKEMQVTLLTDERTVIASRGTTNAQAMVVVSMARAELAKRTMESFADARRFFRKAIEMDPSYADAHSGLARSLALMHSYGDSTDENLSAARDAIAKALAIDEGSADAWATLGLVNMQAGKTEEARQALHRAMSLNANHAMAHMWLGELQEDANRRKEYHARAYELDPRSPVAAYNVANDLFEDGRDAEALDVFSRIVDADPYYPQAYELVAKINEVNGRLAAAIRNYEHSYQLDPRGATALRLASLYIDIGDFDEADRWLEDAKRTASVRDAGTMRWTEIGGYAARGDRARVESTLRPLVGKVEDLASALDATQAAYFLADFSSAIAAWEIVQPQLERRFEVQGNAKRHGWIDRETLPAAIAAAHAYTQVGNDEGSALANNIEAWLDREMSLTARQMPDDWYLKAQLAAIRGDQNLALLDLQRAIDGGWRQHWRPYFEPCFGTILESDIFRSMMAGLAARMDLMSEELEFDGFFAGIARDGSVVAHKLAS